MVYSVAIDLGGTNIGAGVVSKDGELITKVSVPVADSSNIEGLLHEIAAAARLAVSDVGKEISDMLFMGVGIPGVCKSEKGPVFLAPNINWKEIDAVGFLEKELGIPVFLGNDADCAALGEYRRGFGNQFESMLMLTLGTGVGGAIVYKGKLFTGFGPYGGEFGHIPMVHGGVKCGCGKNGCFEAYASATALKRQTRELAAQHPESLIWEMCKGDLNNVGGRTAFDAADMGDATGAAVVEQYISYLADGISGLVNVLRPEVVILGGGVSNQGASLIDPLNEKVRSMCYANGGIEPPKVIKARLGNSAGIIGAGLLGITD